jgi:catechol 2,3-dioxygenase-like lactoylglutathione lyase family enzyme
MIDHLGFRVRNPADSRRFYEACAAALGLAVIDNTQESFLVGRSAQEPIPFLWVGTANPAFWTSDHVVSAAPIHLAFAASSHDAVDRFYAMALEAGGRDNGAPGPRGPQEMGYYAAFVLDPDGNNIEAGSRAVTAG